MNKDEEVDADDLLSETDRTRYKIKRETEGSIFKTEGSIFKTEVTVFHHTDRPLAGK